MTGAATSATPDSMPRRIAAALAVINAASTNPLRLWPEAAYHRPYLRQEMLFREMILISQPEAVRHILVSNAGNYRRTAASIRVIRPLAGRGLLLSEGETWRRQRRVIAPTLAPRAMPLLMHHAADAMADWLAALRPRALAGPVDLLEAMQGLALDIAGRAMFSVDLAPFAAEMRALLQGPGRRVARTGMLDLLLPVAIPTPRDIRRLFFRRRWMGLIERIIARRTATPSAADARDLFDLLRAATAPEGRLGAALLRDEVATLIIAGHETTALTLFWSALLLAEHPEWQDWIAEEAAGADLGPDNAATALEHLPRTRAVISEAMRLYPPAAIIPRQAIGPDRAAGIDIPAGSIVMVAPWVLHRHHDLWSDPDSFDPTRFLPDAPPAERFAYLPFGAGPRVCVGAAFALAEATLGLAAFVRAYEIARTETTPVMPVVVITTQPDHAPPFRLVPRRSSPDR